MALTRIEITPKTAQAEDISIAGDFRDPCVSSIDKFRPPPRIESDWNTEEASDILRVFPGKDGPKNVFFCEEFSFIAPGKLMHRVLARAPGGRE